MMNLRKYLHSAILGWGLAAMLTVGPAAAQQGGATNPQNPDLTRQELASFDVFLDQHPDIDRQLRENPSLINNADFVQDHPELGDFLASHKEISEEIKENPTDFMRRERRFDNAENRMHNLNPDVTRKEIASFDHFLDKHPDIDKQLDANPGLVNDQKFLDHHHDLRAFLKDHPEVREELHENASDFMRREQGFDAAENNRSKSQFDSKNPDLTKKQLAAFDDFLDHHKSIAKDLQKDPNLVNDAKFVKDHNDLKKFMEKNPGVTDELKENPTDFMRQESRFERSDRDHDRRHHDKNARADKDKNKDKHKMTAMEEKEKLQTVNPH